MHGEPGEILDQKAEFVSKRAKLRDAPGTNTKQIADLEQPLKIACLIKKVATAALANVVAAAGARDAAERVVHTQNCSSAPLRFSTARKCGSAQLPA